MAKLPEEYQLPTPKEVRVKLAEVDMSPTEFSRLTGLSQKHVSEWLHEHTNISRVAQMRIADVVEDLGKSQEDDKAS